MVLLAALLCPGAWAEEKEEVVARIRFLAIGNRPPFKQEIVNGVRREIPPEPEEVPPSLVTVMTEAGEDTEAEELAQVRLLLGLVSEVVEIPVGVGGRLELRSLSEGQAPWLVLDRPSAGDHLIMLRRDPGNMGWLEPKAKWMPYQLGPGGLMMVNAADQPLAFVIGEKRLALASGQVWKGSLAPGKAVAFEVGMAAGGGGLERVISKSLEQGEGERMLVVVSEADRDDARLALKATQLRESTRKPLPKEVESP